MRPVRGDRACQMVADVAGSSSRRQTDSDDVIQRAQTPRAFRRLIPGRDRLPFSCLPCRSAHDDTVTSSAHRPDLPPILADTLDVALGRTHRADPAASGSGGPAGNARLTALGRPAAACPVGGRTCDADRRQWLDQLAYRSRHPPTPAGAAQNGNHRVAHRPLLQRHVKPGRHRCCYASSCPVSSALPWACSLPGCCWFLGQDRTRIVRIAAPGQRVDWLTLHQGMLIVWAVLTGLHVRARAVPAFPTHRPAPRQRPRRWGEALGGGA